MTAARAAEKRERRTAAMRAYRIGQERLEPVRLLGGDDRDRIGAGRFRFPRAQGLERHGRSLRLAGGLALFEGDMLLRPEGSLEAAATGAPARRCAVVAVFRGAGGFFAAGLPAGGRPSACAAWSSADWVTCSTAARTDGRSGLAAGFFAAGFPATAFFAADFFAAGVFSLLRVAMSSS